MLTVARLVVTGLLAGLLSAQSPVASASPAATPTARDPQVISRSVVFEVENTNATSVACLPDNASYQLRGQLVGPRADVLGADAPRVNVLVHDMTTGSWFWHLRSHPSYDYATQLARAGETSLVLDRLGYDTSPLTDGNGTCLGAQADMLHQVVQHLRSGHYDFLASSMVPPAAQHVVVHGHSVGAAIAQAEAAEFDDVDGLVLMSWTDNGATSRAVDEASQQSAECLRGADYAPYGQSAREFRALLFATAPLRIQRVAARLRNPAPCGDVRSLTQLVSSANLTTREIEAPVLLLFGGRDALNRRDSTQRQADAFSSSVDVTLQSVAAAGSALPLEKSAGRTRARVLRWLADLG